MHAHESGASPVSSGAASTEGSSEAQPLAGVLAGCASVLAAEASASRSPVQMVGGTRVFVGCNVLRGHLDTCGEERCGRPMVVAEVMQ